MKCYMHVNYLEGVFPIPEIARRAAGAGFEGIEFRGTDTKKVTPSLEHYLHLAGGAARDAGLDLVLSFRMNTKPADAPGREKTLEEFKIVARTAASYGVKILNVFASVMQAPDTHVYHFDKNGSAAATEADWACTVEQFRAAGEFAAEHGVTLCFEMHNNQLHDLAEPTAELLKRINLPNVKANIDWGNIFLNPRHRGLEAEFHTIAPWISYVHVKNMISTQAVDHRLLRGCALQEGDYNTFVAVRKILELGYRGPWTLENVMPGDKRSYMASDLAYFRQILAELTPSAS